MRSSLSLPEHILFLRPHKYLNQLMTPLEELKGSISQHLKVGSGTPWRLCPCWFGNQSPGLRDIAANPQMMGGKTKTTQLGKIFWFIFLLSENCFTVYCLFGSECRLLWAARASLLWPQKLKDAFMASILKAFEYFLPLFSVCNYFCTAYKIITDDFRHFWGGLQLSEEYCMLLYYQRTWIWLKRHNQLIQVNLLLLNVFVL